MEEIILFLGTARAGEHNSLDYPTGERHAVLVFLRQEKGSIPSWTKAAASLREKGWTDVVLSEANPIIPEALPSVDSAARASYEDALKRGSAVIVFSKAV